MSDRILIVDDEPSVRFGVRSFLEAHGYDVDEADSRAAAGVSARSMRPDLAIVDVRLPDGNGLDVMALLQTIDPPVPVILLTAHGTIDMAVNAIKEGAEHFLTKPLELPSLLVIIRRVLERQRNRQRQLARDAQSARESVDPFLGTSEAVRYLAQVARKVASSDSALLIQGETGVGKGVLARWIHQHSPRAEEPLVDLNCAGLARDLLESELFGHERGSFTGATGAKQGLLEIANRGTLFLDEIGDMDPLVQPKILKVLEEQRFRRIGDVRDRQVSIRLIAATNVDLAARVREQRFRSDLYFRINTIQLAVPPLRERSEDVPLLADRLLHSLTADLGCPGVTFAADAIQAMRGHSWPGNVRELRNTIERALLLSERTILGAKDLQLGRAGDSAAPGDAAPELTLLELEALHIERVLTAVKWCVDDAARWLGVPRSTLYQKIKKHGLKAP